MACAAAMALLAAGCGGGDRETTAQAPRPATGTTTAAKPPPKRPKARRGDRSRGAALRVPPGLTVSKKAEKSPGWPRPLKVAASFPIAHTPANASCPTDVIRSMPDDGIYVLVAEYTEPPPKGVPRPTGLGPRPDLRELDIRPSEVECYEEGLSGVARFTEHGRAFRVQVLLGRKVSAARRRQVLDALATLRFG